MTGFKSGAAGSGLDDDDDDTPEDGSDDVEGEQTSVETEGSEGSDSTASKGGIPWLYKRDSITDGRARSVQLHLQRETLRKEQDAKMTVPIEDNVKKADLREAAYLVGLEQLDDVAEKLREWGYDAE